MLFRLANNTLHFSHINIKDFPTGGILIEICLLVPNIFSKNLENLATNYVHKSLFLLISELPF